MWQRCLLNNIPCLWSQLALVGTSVKKDVTELLEKRVRSRFSHQRLLVPEPARVPISADSPPPSPADPSAQPRSRGRRALAAARDAPLAVLEAMLQLPADPDYAASPAHAAYAAQFNAAVVSAVRSPAVVDVFTQRCMWGSGEAEGEAGLESSILESEQ